MRILFRDLGFSGLRVQSLGFWGSGFRVMFSSWVRGLGLIWYEDLSKRGGTP